VNVVILYVCSQNNKIKKVRDDGKLFEILEKKYGKKSLMFTYARTISMQKNAGTKCLMKSSVKLEVQYDNRDTPETKC